jgi:hypothetical protein
MTDITIPPEAIEAAAKAMQRAEPWSSFWSHGDAQKLARAACLAMLRSWPGMHRGHQCTGCGGDPQVILPLIQEPTASSAEASQKAE